MSDPPLTLGLPSVFRSDSLPDAVTIYEVAARDGLQAEQRTIATEEKVRFIQDLRGAGLAYVEATSFVSPRWVPQLADAAEVLARLGRDLDAHPVLVPNRKGLERALEARATTIAVFVSATETFAQRNLGMGRDEAVAVAVDVVDSARRSGLAVRGYISMCFGDPWEGPVEPSTVARVSGHLLDAGCYQVSLGDTIGVGTPEHVRALIATHVERGVPGSALAMHFHDTYGQALANVYAALHDGITCFDAATAGIGGCPFAGSATGNLATEDLLWMLTGLGIESGVDLPAVVDAGQRISTLLGRPSPSRVARALATSPSHQIPARSPRERSQSMTLPVGADVAGTVDVKEMGA